MPYGTLALDQITPSTNLKIVGGVQLNDNSVISTFNSMGMRNRIINGSMDIDQRNAGSSQTITAGAALAYTVDRWYAYCTGANVTAQRVDNTGTAGSPSLYAYQFTGAASVTGIGFGQRIEAVNCYDLAGSTATLGVSLANSLLTTVTWTAYYANTIDTFGTLASPTRTQIATGTFTVNSQLTRYNAQITVPSAATTGIEIVFSVAAQTSGTWTIDNVQFEPGSVATPFERRPVGTELSLCQRYYSKSYSINTSPGSITLNGAITVSPEVTGNVYKSFGTIRFKTTMCVSPTVKPYNPSTGSTTNPVRNTAVSTDLPLAVIHVSEDGFSAFIANASTNKENLLAFQYTAEAEL